MFSYKETIVPKKKKTAKVPSKKIIIYNRD